MIFPNGSPVTLATARCLIPHIWQDARKIAAILQADGIQPGDRVGLLLPNMPEYLTALNGIWLAGGVAVAISPLLVEEEVEKLLEPPIANWSSAWICWPRLCWGTTSIRTKRCW